MLRPMVMRSTAVALVLTLLLTACGSATSTGTQEVSPAWSTAPAAPLSERHSAHAVAVGDELLVFGGDDSTVCAPTADCASPPPQLRDGAAYTPNTGTWRRIADSPVVPWRGAVVEHGGLVYLLTERHLHAYDVGTDSWTELPAPPDTDGRLLSAGQHLLRYELTQEGGQVQADHLYDPSSRTWRALPRDPLAPTFDRGAVWTGDRLVLLGKPEPPPPVDGVDSPTVFVQAAVFDPATWTWSQVPQQDEVIGFGTQYSWTGDRVLLPYTFDYTQGGLNPGGTPDPTGGLLDPVSGDWERLPEPPDPPVHRLRVHAATERRVTAGEGLVLDVENQRWWPLEPAPGAPTEGVAAAWVGRQLVVFGGGSVSATTSRLSRDAYVWTAPH
jgi:hypothetical protein